MTGQWGIAINNTVKPFTDVRVRKALTLGIDRYTGGQGAVPAHRPAGRRGADAPGHRSGRCREAELEKLPGFGRDMEKNRAEARRLLAEAGLSQRLQGRPEEPQREAARTRTSRCS